MSINHTMMAWEISIIAIGNSRLRREMMGIPSTARLGIVVGTSPILKRILIAT
ncbi:hypothetical protein [Sporosarcina sp. ANT_H38]|uniref:hypothetical protein n=1 Tax=Sporosarcina sp. ANT_H38 TaxID=2597358 RepID=UPI00165D9C0D|nr:hypothetical protein [Sporosarcina sp. ANT_H38]